MQNDSAAIAGLPLVSFPSCASGWTQRQQPPSSPHFSMCPFGMDCLLSQSWHRFQYQRFANRSPTSLFLLLVHAAFIDFCVGGIQGAASSSAVGVAFSNSLPAFLAPSTSTAAVTQPPAISAGGVAVSPIAATALDGAVKSVSPSKDSSVLLLLVGFRTR